MEKKWTVKHDCRGMDTSEIIDTILADRGVEDVSALLYPNEDCLIPFDAMKNIKRAASIISKNIENDGSFFVHFDTDTDGISAGSIAVRWLKQHTDRVSYGINQGKEHGVANLDLELLQDTWLCMPEMPTEPISSLSASMHTAVRRGVVSWNMAARQA